MMGGGFVSCELLAMGYHPCRANDNSGIPGPLLGGIETKFAHGANNLHTLFPVLHFNFERALAQIDKQIRGKSVWLMAGHLGGWALVAKRGGWCCPTSLGPAAKAQAQASCSVFG